MAEGVGNAPTSARADPVFKTGAASLYLPAFQKWSGWRELHSRPPPSEGGRLLLTLHPEIGCQTWTRTKTSGLTGRRATLTPPGNGAADRIPTCIVPFRKRMPHVFDHGSNCNWSERQDFHLRPPGPKPGALKTELHSEKKWRTRRELHPQPSRRQRGALLIELRVQMVGSAGNAPARHFRLCFVTPDLQSGRRITSLENW